MRMLLVEDEVRLAGLVAEGLRRAEYTVDVALDGQEALDYARVAAYDAIVLDLMLPGLDGLEVCRRLRQAGTLTPIIMLTARDAIPDRIAGLDSGADDYLVKPFALEELLARLRALLRREAPRKEAILRAGDLSLEPASRTVRWREQPLELTPREYRLLEVLLRRAGRVVGRESIVESVWGFDFTDSSNLVEVYIRRLRRKLAERGAPPLIETARGVGYRLLDA